jgi:myo-inositol-1(or 4)-monophosphatase
VNGPGELAAILRVAMAAAEEAGAILMEHYGRIDRAAVGRKSSARDLVTAADVASERALVARLRAAFPGHAIEAEEEVRDAPRAGPRWFLDPLDGTINFVHQIPAFAVSLGLVQHGAPAVAVVHAPRLGETFAAAAGHGTTLGGQPVGVSGTEALGEALLATGFPYRRGEQRARGESDNLDNFARLFPKVRGMRRLGSAALDLAYVACGRFDGFWELHLAPHDVAAGALLVVDGLCVV